MRSIENIIIQCLMHKGFGLSAFDRAAAFCVYYNNARVWSKLKYDIVVYIYIYSI